LPGFSLREITPFTVPTIAWFEPKSTNLGYVLGERRNKGRQGQERR
jgi:hypothetical protein